MISCFMTPILALHFGQLILTSHEIYPYVSFIYWASKLTAFAQPTKKYVLHDTRTGRHRLRREFLLLPENQRHPDADFVHQVHRDHYNEHGDQVGMEGCYDGAGQEGVLAFGCQELVADQAEARQNQRKNGKLEDQTKYQD